MSDQQNSVIVEMDQVTTSSREPAVADGGLANGGKANGKKKAPKTKEEKKAEADARKKQMTAMIRSNLAMIGVVGPEWILIIIGILAALCSGVMPLLLYLLFGDIMNVFFLPGATYDSINHDIIVISLKMLGVAVLSGIFSFIQTGLLVPTGERVSCRLRKRLFNAISHQEIGFFDKHQTGELLSRLSQDTNTIQAAYSEKLGNTFQYFVQTIAGVIMAFYYSWKMTLVMFATAPFMGFAMMAQGKAVQFFTKKASDASASSNNIAEEVISNMRTVRSFDGEEKECRRYTKNLIGIKIVAILKGGFQGAATGLLFATIWGACAIAFWFGGWLVLQDMKDGYQVGDFLPGDLVRVFGLALFAVMGMAQALVQLPDVIKAMTATTIVMDIIQRRPEIPFAGGKQPESISGEVEFKDVVFKYPTRDGIILKSLNMKVSKGENVALVGHSGCGKSTILSLIERFYEPLEGNVFLDNTNIKELDPRWMHRHIGIVTQEPILFATSIEENIRYGKDNATFEEIVEAAKLANAHNFIMALPDQYRTKVGERGVTLSGGQKQRVAIARAVLKDPKILLLDEATSALDTESEALVQDALEKLMKGRTCFVIAHRLTTVKNSDRIIVIKGGIIVEQGTHAELMELPNGEYAKLADRQLRFGQRSSKEILSESPGDGIALPTSLPDETSQQAETSQQTQTSQQVETSQQTQTAQQVETSQPMEQELSTLQTTTTTEEQSPPHED